MSESLHPLPGTECLTVAQSAVAHSAAIGEFDSSSVDLRDAWQQIAIDTWRMTLSASDVITRRVLQFGCPIFSADHPNQTELSLMTQEKFDALNESAACAAAQALSIGRSLGIQSGATITRHACTLFTHAIRSDATAIEAQLQVMAHELTRQSITVTPNFVGALARVTQSALRPVHRRVLANVRRLSVSD